MGADDVLAGRDEIDGARDLALGNFMAILRHRGLPADQADCRAYAGLSSAR